MVILKGYNDDVNMIVVVHKGLTLCYYEEKVSENLTMVRLRVREVAQAKNYNMSSLSRAADLSFNTVKKIWTNPNWDPKISTLKQIAQVLGVSIDELVEQDTNVSEEE